MLWKQNLIWQSWNHEGWDENVLNEIRHGNGNILGQMPSPHNHDDWEAIQFFPLQPQDLPTNAHLLIPLTHLRTGAKGHSSWPTATQPPKQCGDKEKYCWRFDSSSPAAGNKRKVNCWSWEMEGHKSIFKDIISNAKAKDCKSGYSYLNILWLETEKEGEQTKQCHWFQNILLLGGCFEKRCWLLALLLLAKIGKKWLLAG